MSQAGITLNKVTVATSFALSAFSTLFFLLPHVNDKHMITPFSGIFIVIALYWLVTIVFQLSFIVKVFFHSNESQENQTNVNAIVGPHFIFFNLVHFFWCYLFAKQHFIIAEILLVMNLLNLLMLYFSHKTIEIKNFSGWLTIHLPITGIPLSWTLYAIFWNGACIFHSHNKSLLPRILANIFIWEFLFVPVTLLLFYNDWSVGLSTSFLMLGVGFGQLMSRAIALQWIFAFVISGLNFVVSILSICNYTLRQVGNQDAGDQAPLLA